ncbi:MAG: T9SS C-terminal target domain-containing protein [Bacteroidetes bacterium]|nr:MAG: T9SS C-terminal target domain-containing protein [Bacteroidota bacterium]
MPESFLDGVPFTITNTGSNPVDTLEIHKTADSVHLIIAADSAYIIIGTEEHRLTDMNVFPNPFDRQVMITLQTNDPGPVRAEIYDFHGRKIRTLKDHFIYIEHIVLVWDGKTQTGNDANKGIYFVKTTFGSGTLLVNKVLKL